jgi:tetratricopeptide (TPR) repeat protein
VIGVRAFVVAVLAVGLGLGPVPSVPAEEPTNFPPKARQRFEEGEQLQGQGKYEEAIRAYDDAIRLGMKAFPRVHLYRARSHLDLQKYDVAIAQYTQFLRDFSLEDSCRY